MNTLIISSSLSANSNSYILCREAEKRLQNHPHVKTDFIDIRDHTLVYSNQPENQDIPQLRERINAADNYIIGMGVHCYSVSDSLKSIIDACFTTEEHKLFGVVCAAGGPHSFLATQHLTQIMMNEFRMIQLPRVVFATKKDFENNQLTNADIHERLDRFVDEFEFIGKKLSR